MDRDILCPPPSPLWDDYLFQPAIHEPVQPTMQSPLWEFTEKDSPMEITSSQREKKRQIDQRYRDKMKQRRKEELDDLRTQISVLKKENEKLKINMENLSRTLQSEQDNKRHLEKIFHQVKTQNQTQSILVRVVSERLDSATKIDLQRENVNLKKENQSLQDLIYNQNKVDIFKIEQEKAEAERQKKALNVIVEALCEKIYNEEQQQLQNYES